MRLRRLAHFALGMSLAMNANAALLLDTSFADNFPLGPFKPNQKIDIVVSLTNPSPDHTVTLCEGPCLGDMFTYSLGGLASIPDGYSFYFGDKKPEDVFDGQIEGPLLPGATKSFVFGVYTPDGKAAPGWYSFRTQLQIFDATPDRRLLATPTLNSQWEVRAVPEPALPVLVAVALASMLLFARMRPSRRRTTRDARPGAAVHAPFVFAFAMLLAQVAQAAPVLYFDRGAFLSAVGASITDDYASAGYAAGLLTDAQMSAVLGETKYTALTFPNQNQVGDVFVHGDGSNYCSGCNGNFLLSFEDTSLTIGKGVFGIGLDFVLHTSRNSAIGDVIEGDVSLPGTIRITFANGKFEDYLIPADVGFFGPDPYFFGITDSRRISSILIGTEPTESRHFWVIDDLTIASRKVPEPAGIGLLILCLLALSLRFLGGSGCVRYTR